MIIIYHKHNKVISVWNQSENQKLDFLQSAVVEVLFVVAKKFPAELLIWCHIDLKDNLNIEAFPEIFHHKKIMASYNPNETEFLPDSIGYVEESPFIKINKKMHYPTWQMSSCVGGIHTAVLNKLTDLKSHNFDYFLISLAKKGMPQGLFCYSSPKLLLQKNIQLPSSQASFFTLFKFVKQHYRTRWLLLLFIDFVIYEKKFLIFPLLLSLFYTRKKNSLSALEEIEISSSKKVNYGTHIEVIIPTIGRKTYLYDVLCDFKNQTHLPKKIIIVEQNPLPESTSELDYLQNEVWPFEIEHIFTHQTGACNARNIALSKTSYEWVFLADDDIRIQADFFQKGFENIQRLASDAVTFNCYREDDKQHYFNSFQWTTFGSGCSIVRADVLRGKNFSSKYEFGFGEDADFGMQLRNDGTDIIYYPEPKILHLKAPVGGFRTKHQFPWEHEYLQPKPSPTVMLFKLEHLSKKQLLGYKTILFFKFYRAQPIKNPIRYFNNFQDRWEKSVYWAKEKNR